MSLYFILLLGSIAVPFLLSFDRKLQFYRQWKFVIPSTLIIAAVYIFFDILMTGWGVWGFNSRYHSDIVIWHLPIEEWLFFIVIPYASIFLHESVVLYFPHIQISKKYSDYLSYGFLVFLSVMLLLNPDKTYTVYIFATVILSLLLSLFDSSQTIRSFYLTFLLILVPFFIVNAILTGSFIESEVVWYNDAENLGIRILTIPVEDIGYAFSMILLNLLLIKLFQKKYFKSVKS
ncbi:MAG: lycopene cyclase domain-containing protein [Bacteroidales bacterium]